MDNNFIDLRDQLILYCEEFNKNKDALTLNKIETIIETIEKNYDNVSEYSLWYGLSGIGIILMSIPNIMINRNKINRLYFNAIKAANLKISNYIRNEDFNNLDLFRGSIGMIRFLLEYKGEEETILLITLNRLARIITLQNNLDKIFFKTRKDNQFIDLSISHGAASYLAILFYGYENGYKSIDIEQGIGLLFHYIYNQIQYHDKVVETCKVGSTSVNIFNKCKYNWCYGSFSVLYLLWKINLQFGFVNKKHFTRMFKSEIESISFNNLNTNLFICHGISGIKLILQLLEEEFPREVFQKKELIEEYISKKELCKYENIYRKNCILTGVYSILLTNIVCENKNIGSVIYKMLLLN